MRRPPLATTRWRGVLQRRLSSSAALTRVRSRTVSSQLDLGGASGSGEQQPDSLDLAGTLRRFGLQRVRPWLAHALVSSGFESPSAIQAAVLPAVARHKDVVIHAATGSGKTLAFLVPLISRLEPGRPLQLLVLVPSRELALQMAAQVDQLIHSPTSGPTRADASGLNVVLLVGGLGGSSGRGSALPAGLAATGPGGLSGGVRSPRPADPAALQLHGELSRAIHSCRAEIVVATPSALLKAVRLDEEQSGEDPAEKRRFTPRSDRSHFSGRGGRLLLQLSRSLDAVVLDEVDALMPKPVVQGATFYAKADWKTASREERKRARSKGGDAWGLLRLLSRGLAEVRRDSRGSHDRMLGRDRAGRPILDVQRAYRELRDQRACFQLVAASATVGTAMVGHLMRVLPLPERPVVITASHAEAGHVTPSARGPGSRRGPGGVRVPKGIRHWKVQVAAPEAKAAAAALTLRSVSSRSALLVLPDDAPIRDFVAKLQAAGLPQATMLHQALGFPARAVGAHPVEGRGAAGAPSGAGARVVPAPSVRALLRRFMDARRGDRPLQPSGGALAGADGGWGEAAGGGSGGEAGGHHAPGGASRPPPPPVVLVTTEASCRGLDLPGLDCVLLMYCPLTSDAYTHLAGRTGRGRAEGGPGTVVSLLTREEVGFLGLFTRQLRISIKELKGEGMDGWPFATGGGGEPAVEGEGGVGTPEEGGAWLAAPEAERRGVE